jgi:hypothetical protein
MTSSPFIYDERATMLVQELEIEVQPRFAAAFSTLAFLPQELTALTLVKGDVVPLGALEPRQPS